MTITCEIQNSINGLAYDLHDPGEQREVEAALEEHTWHPIRRQLAGYYLSLFQVDGPDGHAPFDDLSGGAQIEVVHRTDRIVDTDCL